MPSLHRTPDPTIVDLVELLARLPTHRSLTWRTVDASQIYCLHTGWAGYSRQCGGCSTRFGAELDSAHVGLRIDDVRAAPRRAPAPPSTDQGQTTWAGPKTGEHARPPTQRPPSGAPARSLWPRWAA